MKTALDPECDLFTIAPDYTESVRRAGGLPLLAVHVEGDEIDELLDTADALLISGGQDMDPATYGQDNTSSWKVRRESDDFDLEITRRAVERDIPVLGICRGAQVVNVALGGDLAQEVQEEGSAAHPTYREMAPTPRLHRHDVDVVEGSRLAALYGDGPLAVNSLHHQAIGAVADRLVVTARSDDGVVEAVEGAPGSGLDLLAVQWHPEMLAGERGGELFADLVERARARVTMTT
ncbi:MAG: gamma-glutamyl-gamma-aminobutyrate hydrolase family protein [Acidimicrobiales bacterium]|nr:gamma-glutamyl-gamma-aminobutyrate hydrolase family protein [Acidimicrobiales bacterium]